LLPTVVLLKLHHGGFVTATISHNINYIRHVSAIGNNTMFIWQVYGWPP
jgi:hypothetical protein